MDFVCLPFASLTNIQLYAIMRLRSEVFVLEQQCLYQDLDDKDLKEGVQHLLMVQDEKLLGYSRLLPANISYSTPSMGRIVISPQARNRSLGKLLIQESIKRCSQTWPNTSITIGAQSHLSKLYQSFGFNEISEHYLEDDILHVDMRFEAS